MGDLSFGLLNVLAGSPLYKSVIRQALNEFFDPEKCAKETEKLLLKDQEFAATLFSLMPATANASLGILRGVNRYTGIFTTDAYVSLLKSVLNDFDAKYAAETLNETFDGFERLMKERPDLPAEITAKKFEEFVDALDFGKLRGFVEQSAYCMKENSRDGEPENRRRSSKNCEHPLCNPACCQCVSCCRKRFDGTDGDAR